MRPYAKKHFYRKVTLTTQNVSIETQVGGGRDVENTTKPITKNLSIVSKNIELKAMYSSAAATFWKLFKKEVSPIYLIYSFFSVVGIYT